MPVPVLGDECVGNGNFASDSVWGKADGAAITPPTANLPNGAAIHQQMSAFNGVIGDYCLEAVTVVSGSGELRFPQSPNLLEHRGAVITQ